MVIDRHADVCLPARCHPNAASTINAISSCTCEYSKWRKSGLAHSTPAQNNLQSRGDNREPNNRRVNHNTPHKLPTWMPNHT